MLWFTADQHFLHYNIIEHCGRPFKNVNEMGTCIIDNFNSLVNYRDEVFHLGDFTMMGIEQAKRHLDALNGIHFFIRGNHDRKNMVRAGFEWEKDVYLLKVDGYKIWLSHYAHRSWPNKSHGGLHLHGHSHGLLPIIDGSMDVGVDPNNFRPVSVDRVIAMVGKGGFK